MTNVGKSMAIAQLAMTYPDKKVHAFDGENELENLLEEFNLTIPNLTIKKVTPDWPKLDTDYKATREELGKDDWCCFDMMGVLWDLAQNYYSKATYGVSPAQHIIKLREQAKRADFNGFDGLTEWPVIKRMHNEDLVDDAVRWSDFNVLATTSLGDLSPKGKRPDTGVEGLMASEFNKRLEGEKHNIYRFRTIAILYYDMNSRKFFYKIVKEKGDVASLPLKAVEFTGSSFIDVYMKNRGK